MTSVGLQGRSNNQVTLLNAINWLLVASLACALASGIYLASYLPSIPKLLPAGTLLVAAALLVVVSIFLMLRIDRFAWNRFSRVATGAFAAYVVIAAILTFVFVYDGARGDLLVILIGSLAVFACDVPIIIAYTVTRYVY
jgi:hypothetical protein